VKRNEEVVYRPRSACGPVRAIRTPKVAEALSDMASDAQRASAIIQRLRALSRKDHARQTGLDLDDMVTLLRHDFVRRQITVLRAFDPVLPTISGDPVQLQQVVLNLLVNASEAIAQSDGGKREIAVTTRYRSPGVVEMSATAASARRIRTSSGCSSGSSARSPAGSEWVWRSADRSSKRTVVRSGP
jgi:signal transduction histidine kinase